jgi:hypothetical protein
MSLGDRLVDKLKKAPKRGELGVEDEGVRATADVVGSGPYGAEVRGISVERTAPRQDGAPPPGERMQRAVERIEREVRYLSEPLEALECDPASGRGILRTRREAVKGKEYFEVEVAGGDRVDVGRFRGGSDGARSRLKQNFGHDALRRLVDDLSEVVGDPAEEAEE